MCLISNPSVDSNRSYSPETLNSGQNRQFLVPCDIEIWWMTLKKMGHFFYAMLSFAHHFKAFIKFKLKLQSGNGQFGSNSAIFSPCDLEIWQVTLKNNRASLLYCLRLCASFHSHQWILTGVTVRKRPIWVNIDVFCLVWPWIFKMILKNNRAPLLCCFKLCASFGSHRQIKTQVTVRKR